MANGDMNQSNELRENGQVSYLLPVSQLPVYAEAEMAKLQAEIARDLAAIKAHAAGRARHYDPETAAELDAAIKAGHEIDIPEL